jgi:hypothetical protein
MPDPVAILGIGFTPAQPTSTYGSYKEMMFEAAQKAYLDAGIEAKEVDSFVTCAEDLNEGLSIFDEYTPDQLDGIDYCSSNNSVVCNVRQISVPVLFTAMGAHYFIRDTEIHYENAASLDKDFVVIAGLLHSLTPCNACPGGPYNNSLTNFYNYVRDWINARF